MYVNGQQIVAFLGEDRQLYINQSPGKTLCEFSGRVFLNAFQDKHVISITNIPDKFDGDRVLPPPGFVVQGI